MSGSYIGNRGGGSLKLEETELRLGLPGGGHEGDTTLKTSGKRGFAQTTVDLELNLPAGGNLPNTPEAKKNIPKEIMNLLPRTNDPAKPPAPKAQVVGWPPVRSFRKNMLAVQSGKDKSIVVDQEGADQKIVATSGGAMVKVSMDGAPYLRKVDLKMFKSYHELSLALDNMFNSFTIRKCGSEGINGMRGYMKERKLVDVLNGSEYVPTYEDKDGDWMLVGDVPWEMFVDSCKRLRIMKGSEAINGLAPRTMEKCKEQTVKS